MRELILYATPTGALADQCDRYFEHLEAAGLATTAQTYPPHCTLTGFFHRPADRAEAVAAEFNRGLAAAGPVPDDSVEVVGLVTKHDWVGLELRSSWLHELTVALAEAHVPSADDDRLRIKDWLHLSLAYGVADLDRQAEAARKMVDPEASVGWEVGLWERRQDRERAWLRLTPS